MSGGGPGRPVGLRRRPRVRRLRGAAQLPRALALPALQHRQRAPPPVPHLHPRLGPRDRLRRHSAGDPATGLSGAAESTAEGTARPPGGRPRSGRVTGTGRPFAVPRPARGARADRRTGADDAPARIRRRGEEACASPGYPAPPPARRELPRLNRPAAPTGPPHSRVGAPGQRSTRPRATRGTRPRPSAPRPSPAHPPVAPEHDRSTPSCRLPRPPLPHACAPPAPTG